MSRQSKFQSIRDRGCKFARYLRDRPTIPNDNIGLNLYQPSCFTTVLFFSFRKWRNNFREIRKLSFSELSVTLFSVTWPCMDHYKWPIKRQFFNLELWWFFCGQKRWNRDMQEWLLRYQKWQRIFITISHSTLWQWKTWPRHSVRWKYIH